MVTSNFDYFAPTSVDEATSLLSKYRGEAKVLAGGHSLIPMMKLRLAEPTILVDIGRIEGLSYVNESNDGVAIGSMTTCQVEPRPCGRSRSQPSNWCFCRHPLQRALHQAKGLPPG